MGQFTLHSNPLAKPVFNPIQNGRIAGMDFTRASNAWQKNSVGAWTAAGGNNIPNYGYGYWDGSEWITDNKEGLTIEQTNTNILEFCSAVSNDLCLLIIS